MLNPGHCPFATRWACNLLRAWSAQT